ncbi:hypothetical protein ACFHYQ_03445 [Sphaerimonospora cavernae]|uniref:Uncharacterized protein n=1 Tax=Sphaerimonospora cavernae TaxID=1740611 RepID=A0ABV6TYS9_9ACTN
MLTPPPLGRPLAGTPVPGPNRDPADLPETLRRLPGSLTATVHAAGPTEARDFVPVLRRLAGRLIWNGWPTGVAVCRAMHHGGP